MLSELYYFLCGEVQIKHVYFYLKVTRYILAAGFFLTIFVSRHTLIYDETFSVNQNQLLMSYITLNFRNKAVRNIHMNMVRYIMILMLFIDTLFSHI